MADPYALAAADPVSAILAWLSEHPKVTEVLGGPGHVSGLAEAPWPHLVVSHGPGGDMRQLRWAAQPDVTLEVYGDPGGWPGSAELRRITLVCALAAQEVVDADPQPAGPVICGISWNSLVSSPLISGQPRWLIGASVTLHP